jgi:hypothetical protein
MKKKMRRDEIISLLFSLTNESVEFRNSWRGLIGIIAWLILSSLIMVVMIFGSGAQGWKNIAVIIGMSLLKYIPLLMVVYKLARFMAARYLDDIYELNDEDLASDFLEEVIFGYGRHQITINEGRISEQDERSPLILIGGPGEIQVNLDSITVLETVTGEPKVIYPSNDPWKLGRFERIREIGRYDEVGKREYAVISLRDQFLEGLSIRSRTKDGIPMEAQGIKVIFSVLRRQSGQSDKVQGDAYLFDEHAVQSLVYNQSIITPEPSAPSGIPFPWDTTVIPLVIFELEELIKSHTLSEILASVSQKEIDNASTNEQTIAQMRLEMTGQQITVGTRKETHKFESRSKITAQFFEKKFKEKAAKLGVSIEWIDIGTWQIPNTLILDKHKEAWNLSRENAKKNVAVERSRKKHETEEILKIVENVIIKNFDKTTTLNKMPDKQIEKLLATNPEEVVESRRQMLQQGSSQKKDPKLIAQEMLNSFRKELLAAMFLIKKDNRPLDEKQDELAIIEKALYNISQLTPPHSV